MEGRIPQVTPKEIIRALERLGFVIRRQTGSHVILKNMETGAITTIPFHVKDIKRPLLFGILKQAGISKETLLSVL